MSPVGQVRRGVTDVALTSREMIISAVSSALQTIISSSDDTSIAT